MEEIKLTKDVSIYRLNIGEYNKERLIKELKLNIKFNERTSDFKNQLDEDGTLAPGIQSDIIIQSTTILNIINWCICSLQTTLNIVKLNPYWSHNWVYISDKTNERFAWHDHKITRSKFKNQINEWTYTFYVQMPEVININEGHILFATTDGVIHQILPTEGDVIIFPANLMHVPQVNISSKNERIVIGGIFNELDLEKDYNAKKTNNSII